MKLDYNEIPIPRTLTKLFEPIQKMTFKEFKTAIFSYEIECKLYGQNGNKVNFEEIKQDFLDFVKNIFCIMMFPIVKTTLKLLIQFMKRALNYEKKFDEDKFKQFIAVSGDINYKYNYGQALLFKNAWDHLKFGFLYKTDVYLKNCRLLLEYGADPYIKDDKKKRYI